MGIATCTSIHQCFGMYVEPFQKDHTAVPQARSGKIRIRKKTKPKAANIKIKMHNSDLITKKQKPDSNKMLTATVTVFIMLKSLNVIKSYTILKM